MSQKINPDGKTNGFRLELLAPSIHSAKPLFLECGEEVQFVSTTSLVLNRNTFEYEKPKTSDIDSREIGTDDITEPGECLKKSLWEYFSKVEKQLTLESGSEYTVTLYCRGLKQQVTVIGATAFEASNIRTIFERIKIFFERGIKTGNVTKDRKEKVKENTLHLTRERI